MSVGSVGVGRDHLRQGSAVHPAHLQSAHGHLNMAQPDVDMLPRVSRPQQSSLTAYDIVPFCLLHWGPDTRH